MLSYSLTDHVALQAIITASATLGALGAATLLVLFFHSPHMHTSAVARIVAAIAVADLISAIAKSIGRLTADSGGGLCQAQAAFMQMGDLSACLWTLTISLNLALITYFRHSVGSVQRYERWYAVFCFGVPFITAVVPLFLRVHDPARPGVYLRVYGDADLWCWVVSPLKIERAILMYIPIGFVFTANLIAYVAVGTRVYRTAKALQEASARSTIDREYAARAYLNAYLKNTMLYLAAFLFTWTPSVIARLVTFVHPGERAFALHIIMGLCSPARGLTNLLVYIYVSRHTILGSGGATSRRQSAVEARNGKDQYDRQQQRRRKAGKPAPINVAARSPPSSPMEAALSSSTRLSPMSGRTMGEGMRLMVTPATPRPDDVVADMPDMWLHEIGNQRRQHGSVSPLPLVHQRSTPLVAKHDSTLVPSSIASVASSVLSNTDMSSCHGTPKSWRRYSVTLAQDALLGSVPNDDPAAFTFLNESAERAICTRASIKRSVSSIPRQRAIAPVSVAVCTAIPEAQNDNDDDDSRTISSGNGSYTRFILDAYARADIRESTVNAGKRARQESVAAHLANTARTPAPVTRAPVTTVRTPATTTSSTTPRATVRGGSSASTMASGDAITTASTPQWWASVLNTLSVGTPRGASAPNTAPSSPITLSPRSFNTRRLTAPRPEAI